MPIQSTVLDIGCGDHQLWVGGQLNWWDYMGFDASLKALELAREKALVPDYRLGHVYSLDDIKDYVEVFNPDFILMKDVLQHWEDEEIAEFMDAICPTYKGTMIVAHNHSYFRKPEMNLLPRKLDRYSWAPVAEYHPTMVKHGFVGVRYYPRGKFKLISVRRG